MSIPGVSRKICLSEGRMHLECQFYGVRQEFDIIGVAKEPHLFNEVLVNCIELPCKEFCSLCSILELGITVLVGLIEVCCCTSDCFD